MGTIDLGYYAYLATNVPPLDIARAVGVRLYRTARSGLHKVSPKAPPDRSRSQLVGPRPSLLDPREREATAALLRDRYGEACTYVVREAEQCRDGSLPIFGKWKDCRKEGAPLFGSISQIDYSRDPLAPQVRYHPGQPGMSVNLFQPGADAKAAWEVGRLQHLWRFGQARWLAHSSEVRSQWAQAYVATLRQFRADCPAGFGVQWSCAMEVSARAMHIALSFAYIQDDPVIDAAFVTELLDLLEEHCDFIEEHLEETATVRTNHYAADLVGLVVVGALFPELHRSRVWLHQFGRKLWNEIGHQVRDDGTHFESSTGYQRLCAELFLAAYLAAQAGGAPAPLFVHEKLSGLFRSIGELLNPSGNIPQLGDLDSCRGLPLMPRRPLDCGYLSTLGAAALRNSTLKIPGFPCPVEVAWLLGPAGVEKLEAMPAQAAHGSLHLADAGLAVLRKGDAWLFLSAGPNGQGGCGGHAHNDKNSVELSFGSLDLLLDRGTFVYARDPAERDRRRGTAGHSTVQIDGAEQNRIIPGRLFALPDTANAAIRSLGSSRGLERATGEHAGYRGLAPGVLHRRTAALEEKAAAFCDQLLGAGEHVFESRWFVPHLDLRPRLATPEERSQFEALLLRAFGSAANLQRVVQVHDASGRAVALFGFAAEVELRIDVTETDVSPGYAERAEARLITARGAGAVPAELQTAVILL